MNSLHYKLREKKELHYEARHIVGATLGLVLFGAAMFYSGMMFGQRGLVPTESNGVGEATSVEDEHVVELQNEPHKIQGMEKPELVMIANMGGHIPARAPKSTPEDEAEAAAQDSTAGRLIAESQGPVPLPARTHRIRSVEPQLATPKRKPTLAIAPAIAPAPRAVPERIAATVPAPKPVVVEKPAPVVVKKAVAVVAKPAPKKTAPSTKTKTAPPTKTKTKKAPKPRSGAKMLASRNKTPKRPSVNKVPTRNFTIQVHAFKDEKTAKEVANVIGNFRGVPTKVREQTRDGIKWYRVSIGKFSSVKEAKAYQKAFEEHKGLGNTFLTAL
ncbi:MAG: hypothetical protein CMH54_04510 [Myxococcales bacterium]|nr:hypothetical protein [Myxococcales bacterium]